MTEQEICDLLRYKKFSMGEEKFLELLFNSLSDTRVKVRRYAVIAAGRETWSLPSIEQKIETELLKVWDKTSESNERRYIVEALSKVGGESSYEFLKNIEVSKTDSSIYLQSISRAKVLFERRFAKSDVTQWQMRNIFPLPMSIRLWCRRGLESLLVRQFDNSEDIEFVKTGPAFVDILLYGSPEILFQNRIFTRFGFSLKSLKKDPLKKIPDALFSKVSRQILSTLSSPPYRIRVEHVASGPQRALQWKIAEEILLLAEKNKFSIINETRQADWEILVFANESSLYLSPKSFKDPRFNYRLADVPAASHPTIAAAMVQVALVKEDDLVWDPFLGSGTELVECYKACKGGRFLGTDLEEKALEIAKLNLDEAVGKKEREDRFELLCADALSFFPEKKVSLIISNPPMGRRVAMKDVEDMLVKFVRRLPLVLARQGRLVWMSPFPTLLDRELKRLGLTKTFSSKVDMGGFSAELQKWS